MVQKIKISVRNLVEFVYRSGSIDASYAGISRALEGIRQHQRIQRIRNNEAKLSGGTYQKEVSFKKLFHYSDFDLEIIGRADGIGQFDGRLFVEEIKTTIRPLDTLTPKEVHFAQGMLYAFFYATDHQLDTITVLLTYCNIETLALKEFERHFTLKELALFFNDSVALYIKWARLLAQWQSLRNSSIAEFEFPFAQYRKGQREMAVAVYKSIEQRKNLFASAPTGIGKTISTLFPSIKAVEKAYAQKIFYLTAKTITGTAALSTLRMMIEKGLRFKVIMLTAKEKICPQEKTECTPLYCTYADGHYDRVNEAVAALFKENDIFDRETLLRYGKTHHVCPFELGLDASLYADCVIGDYNYAFDPQVYLRRFFDESEEEFICLIDEAHNLTDRAREMYSASIALKDISSFSKGMPKKNRKMQQITLKMQQFMKENASRLSQDDYGLLVDVPGDFMSGMIELIKLIDAWLVENKPSKHYEMALEFYFNLLNFSRAWELKDERYTVFLKNEGLQTVLTVYCLDPSKNLALTLKKMRSAIFFSATLTPLTYFRAVLGGHSSDYLTALPSPFSPENYKVLIAGTVSTKYKARESSYGRIVALIYHAVKIKKGNYMVFFPSYIYMETVHALFTQEHPSIATLMQQKNMAEEDREHFLAAFSADNRETLVGFCVLGGLFSEGIDLEGERLIGVVIVGVGLPKLGFERNLISEFYNRQGQGMGFEYAYQYPGMNKVLQAGGRVIRTMQDKGFSLLIDTRFLEDAYGVLLPDSWAHYEKIWRPQEVTEKLGAFWDLE